MINFTDLEKKLKLVNDNFLKEETIYKEKIDNLNKKEEVKKIIVDENENLDKARVLLLECNKYQRASVKKQYEDTITTALQFIRNEDISFHIKEREVRGRTEIEFLIRTVRDGVEVITDIEKGRGDGIFDCVNIALDITNLHLSKFAGVLSLDEPAKQVSEIYRERVGAFIKACTTSLGRQVIMTTHDRERLASIFDRKYLIDMENNESTVTLIDDKE